ncbi:MAG: SPOR domain-containing protein, partial [Candidatus Sumerlaeia bacterium]|nr:SPOR domain-containing protein [Candidatus Sumerlaeia bacterium]
MIDNKKVVFSFILYLIVCRVIAVEVPLVQNIHSIQVGAYLEKSAANDRKAELEQLGYSPIFISAEPPYYKVRFGEFEYYVDAYIYWKFMREHGSPDAFIVKIPNTTGRTNFDPPSAPLPRIFSPSETNISQAPDFTLNFNDEITSPLLPLLDKGEEEGYIPKDMIAAKPLIERIVEVLPNTDPRKGWAMTRLGAMELAAEHYDTARSYFLPVVNGEVKARKLDRIKAMRRVAWTYHIQGERLIAYRAYRELERFTASDLIRAIAQVECAG